MAEWHERVVEAQANLRRAYDAYQEAIRDEDLTRRSRFMLLEAKLRATRRRELLCARLRAAKEVEHELLRPIPRDDDLRKTSK